MIIDEGEEHRDWANEALAFEEAGRWRDGLRCRYRALVSDARGPRRHPRPGGPDRRRVRGRRAAQPPGGRPAVPGRHRPLRGRLVRRPLGRAAERDAFVERAAEVTAALDVLDARARRTARAGGAVVSPPAVAPRAGCCRSRSCWRAPWPSCRSGGTRAASGPLDPRSDDRLGTSAMVALAREFGAEVRVTDRLPGDDTDVYVVLADFFDDDQLRDLRRGWTAAARRSSDDASSLTPDDGEFFDGTATCATSCRARPAARSTPSRASTATASGPGASARSSTSRPGPTAAWATAGWPTSSCRPGARATWCRWAGRACSSTRRWATPTTPRSSPPCSHPSRGRGSTCCGPARPPGAGSAR